MKHVFVINPKAGKKNKYEAIINELTAYKNCYDIEIYQTTNELDATQFVKNYLLNFKDEVRFYACGGDGTLNEVVNGAVGYPNASVSLYPCGSGNDFVKCIGNINDFNNLDKLLNSENKEIDVIKINDKYSINVINVGFEAYVCKTANKLKKNRTQNAYTLGIISALFKALKNNVTIEVEGEVLNESGVLLLASLANGEYVGGKYKCAPNYVIDDGLLEICVVKPTNVFNFLSLIKYYEKGEHLNPDNKRIAKLVTYRQGKSAKIYGEKDFYVCIDGEIIKGNEFTVEILHKALKFGVPN